MSLYCDLPSRYIATSYVVILRLTSRYIATSKSLCCDFQLVILRLLSRHIATSNSLYCDFQLVILRLPCRYIATSNEVAVVPRPLKNYYHATLDSYMARDISRAIAQRLWQLYLAELWGCERFVEELSTFMQDADRQASTANQAYSEYALERLQISIVSVLYLMCWIICEVSLPVVTSKLKLLITFVVSYLHFSGVWETLLSSGNCT